MRVFVVLLFLSTMAGVGYGQSMCTDTTALRFSSRGIKLGLTVDEVFGMIATSEEDKARIRGGGKSGDEDLGHEIFGYSPMGPNEKFRGVSSYNFEFLDGKLVGLTISYMRPKWLNAAQFVDKLRESVDLPKIEEWKNSEPKAISTHLRADCGNYSINLYIAPDSVGGRGPTYSGLGIKDNRVLPTLKERRAKKDETQREIDLRTFKP